MSRFDQCLKFVLEREGGYVCDSSDRGGATNCGITQSTYDDYRVRAGRNRQPVVGIDANEISDIYRLRYWKVVHGDKLPRPVDLVVFDAAVNHGPRQAILFLQRAVGAEDDGVIGPQTIAAVQADHKAGLSVSVAAAIIVMRREFYERLVARDATQAKFLKGWNNRLDHLSKEIA